MTLYATDLDGTLLNQNAVISENSVRILNGLLDKGLMLTVASGRSPVTGLKLLEALHLCLPVALLNGGLIYDPAERKAVGCLTFSPEARSILAKAEEETNFGGFAITMRQGKILLHAGKPDDPRGYREWMAAGVPYDNCPIRDIPVEEELFCAYYTSYDEAHIRAFYEKICCCQDIRVGLYRNDYEPEKWCIEVNHRDASKASAVLRIREMTGADRLVVFGDAEILLSLYYQYRRVPFFHIAGRGKFVVRRCAVIFPVRSVEIFVGKENFFGRAVPAAVIERPAV